VIETLSQVGELVGGIGALAALVYLATQIRQNSAIARAHIRQSLADSQIQYLNTRATDPYLRGAAEKIYSDQEVDADESYGLRVHLAAHIRLFENYFAQHTLGTLDLEDWRSMREIVQRQFHFRDYRRAFYSQESSWNSQFAAEVRQILLEIEDPVG
jgi:hypothetical protein